MIKKVAFFGYADAKPKSRLYQEAFATAKLLARHGYTIVNGGGPGVMDASTQGAVAGGGDTIAVTFNPQDAPGFEGRYVRNIVDKEIKTSNYIERMFKLMEQAEAFVIFRGGTGTISEFGTAWVLARLYYGHHKPFVLYGEFWKEIVEVLMKYMEMRGTEKKVFKIVTTATEVFEAIKEFDRELSRVDHEWQCEVCRGRITENV